MPSAKLKSRRFPRTLRVWAPFPDGTFAWFGWAWKETSKSSFESVESALSPVGFEREARGFSPHVTLGRVGRPGLETNRELRPKIAALGGVDLGSFTVDRFYLKKSTLTRGGPIYEDLAEFCSLKSRRRCSVGSVPVLPRERD